MWGEGGTKSLVVGMWQVHGAIFFAVEGQKVGMCEAVVQAFGAIVKSPFERFDFLDFGRQSQEGVFYFLDLLGCGAILKLEKHDVSEHGFYLGSFGHFGF